MQRDSQATTMVHVPTADEAAQAVDQTRRMFNRTLACWASDMLGARRAGVTRIGWQPGRPTAVWRQAA
jgi:hypothetical protein